MSPGTMYCFKVADTLFVAGNIFFFFSSQLRRALHCFVFWKSEIKHLQKDKFCSGVLTDYVWVFSIRSETSLRRQGVIYHKEVVKWLIQFWGRPWFRYCALFNPTACCLVTKMVISYRPRVNKCFEAPVDECCIQHYFNFLKFNCSNSFIFKRHKVSRKAFLLLLISYSIYIGL